MKKFILGGCMFVLALSLCGCPKQLVKDINIPMDNDVKVEFSSTTLNVEVPIEIEKVIDVEAPIEIDFKPEVILGSDNKIEINFEEITSTVVIAGIETTINTVFNRMKWYHWIMIFILTLFTIFLLIIYVIKPLLNKKFKG